MAGWKILGTIDRAPIPKTVEQEARAYFQILPAEEKHWLGNDDHINYYEDRTGQHAGVLDAFHDSEFWAVALIYDRDNRRIRVLRYSWGSYME